MKFSLKKIDRRYYECEVYINGIVPTESLTSKEEIEMLLAEAEYLVSELTEVLSDIH